MSSPAIPLTATPATTGNEQLLLQLEVPDTSYRKVIHVVCDAGSLVAALESGIPDANTLREGLLKIPRPDWTIEYSTAEAQANTFLTATRNSAGTHPFTVHLTRSVGFLAPEGTLSTPQISYRGSIHYCVARMERAVFLDDHPQLLATVIPLIEQQLQEPSVRDHKISCIENEAKACASTIERLIKTLSQPDIKEFRSTIEGHLCNFLVEAGGAVLRTWKGEGYHWEMGSVQRAFLFSPPSGEAISLARINILWCDAYGNQEREEAVLLVVLTTDRSKRLAKILLEDGFSDPHALRKAVWTLTVE